MESSTYHSRSQSSVSLLYSRYLEMAAQGVKRLRRASSILPDKREALTKSLPGENCPHCLKSCNVESQAFSVTCVAFWLMLSVKDFQVSVMILTVYLVKYTIYRTIVNQILITAALNSLSTVITMI